MNTFQENFKLFRKRRGYTQQALSIACGWDASQGRIANYENGRRTPDVEDLQVLAKAFGVKVGQFFNENPESGMPDERILTRAVKLFRFSMRVREETIDDLADDQLAKLLCIAYGLVEQGSPAASPVEESNVLDFARAMTKLKRTKQ